MSLNQDNKKFLTSDGLKTLLQNLNQKNAEQAALIYNDINVNKAYIDVISKELNNLESVTSQKLDNSGDQIFNGNLTVGTDSSNGNLRVHGDLIVDGKTTTADTETLLVKDNFIVINSDNEDLQTALAGIAIKTGENKAYGIAYDRQNGSVSLGEGVVNSDNNFAFNLGEANPIVTRSQSDQLKDGQILVWDADTNKIVGSEAYSYEKLEETFTNWDAHHALVKSVEDLDAALLEEKSIRTTADESLSKIIEQTEEAIRTDLQSVQEQIVKISNDITNVDEMNSSITAILDQINQQKIAPDKLWALSFEPIYNSRQDIIGYSPCFQTMDDGILD